MTCAFDCFETSGYVGVTDLDRRPHGPTSNSMQVLHTVHEHCLSSLFVVSPETRPTNRTAGGDHENGQYEKPPKGRRMSRRARGRHSPRGQYVLVCRLLPIRRRAGGETPRL